jgi:hypothetical protein
MVSRSTLIAALLCSLIVGALAGCKKSSSSSAAPAPSGPPPLLLSGVNPASGTNAGGTTITITGQDFVTGATVDVGGTAATGVTVVDANTITAVTPAGAVGPASIVVTAGGRTGTLSGGFMYVGPVPTVTGISPTSGPSGGGTTVNINGTNFFAGATVTIGGVAATVTSVAPTVIAATTAAGPVGPQNVVVTNLDANNATLTNGYTYVGPAPGVTSVAPSSGTNAGGTTVTITGANFVAGATVTIGGVAAGSVTVVSATRITATTPNLAPVVGPQNVVVTNVDAQSGSLAGGFNALGPQPTLTSLNPTSGTTGGGTLVTLTGTNFAAGAAVTFGGTAGTSVTVVSATSITVFTPARSAGAVNVVITNLDGRNATLSNGYTYVTGPTISTINPASGTVGGGTVVTITGSNFASNATVSFNGNAGTSITVTGTTQITVTTPSSTVVGPVNVQVTNPPSQSTTSVGGYSYLGANPTVTAVNPGSGPNGGGTTITLTGTNFYPGAAVTVGGIAAGSITVVSATSITAVTPNLAPAIGPQNVVVTNLDGNSGTGTGVFNALGAAPTVSGVNAGSGPNGGGTTVTISGTNFVAGATVTIGGQAATSITVLSGNSLRATTPSVAPAIGPQAVVVTNIDGLNGSLAGGFNALGPLPTVTAITPVQGPNGGGTTVTITGTNFATGATVRFGTSAPVSATFVNSTTLTASTPNVAPAQGAVNVLVTNIDGRSGTLSNGYTYLGPAPTLSSVAPTTGANTGGNTITLTGTNFVFGATVTVGGSTAGSVNVVSGTSITCVVPNLSTVAGPVAVVVTNPDNQTASLGAGYSLTGPAPAFTSINANSGPRTGGTTVTITGSNLLTGATVTIGGIAATGVTVTPSSTIVCDTPDVSPSLGPRDVVVTNGDGKSATGVGAFNALAPTPTFTSINPTSGPRTGGTRFTITGTNFFAGATVTVGGVLCGSIDVLSNTQVAGTVLNSGVQSGAVNVVVTNVDGRSATGTGAFTLNGNSNPTITVISPDEGPQAGGTTVQINGTNFAAGATVTFDGVAATVQSITRGTIIAVTGARAGTPPLTGNVVVTNPGPAAATLTNGWTYLGLQPVITGISPTSGPQAGGNTVTITGSGFASGASVFVSNRFTPGGSVSVNGAGTQLTVVMPNVGASTGALRISVENPNGLMDFTRGYLFEGPLPTVSGVNAASGGVGGGTFVTVSGTNFIPGATVEFNGVKATRVTVNGFPGSTLTCYTPPAAATGAVTVKVTNDDNRAGQQASGFTYNAGPVITSVAPTSGNVAGGTAVTLTGTGFATGDTVDFGGTVATSIVVVNATTITCVTPGGPYGPAHVRVTPSTGPTARLIDAYTYRNGVNAQTAPYVWDTSAGIDCTRRWYVNLNEAATLKDFQNRSLQSWGTPGDNTRPPANLPLVDQYVLDWMRAYVLRACNVIYGRNTDGTKVSGKSINITFTGLRPTGGTAAPWVCGPNDYSVISCGGCNGGTGFKASQSGGGCSGGVIGTAPYDNGGGSTPCNSTAEHVSNNVYHNCTGCGSGLGIFAANILNAWGQSLSPRISASDQQYLDGTVNGGTRYLQLHDFMQQAARRIAFVACHEMGHSLGLAADGIVGACNRSSGQCGATAAHTSCCGGNLMAPSISLSASIQMTEYFRGFGGNPDPGNPAKAASCGNPTTSWAVLQSYLGTSP